MEVNEIDNRFKVFLEAYKALNGDHVTLRAYLKSTELSSVEVRIIKSLYTLMRNKPKDALELLNGITTQNFFLTAYKHLALGIVFNHMCKYSEASKHLVRSIKLLETNKCYHHLYRPIRMISRVYVNLQELKRLKKYYELYLTQIKPHTPDELIDFEYQVFISYLENEPQKMRQHIQKIYNLYPEKLEKTKSVYFSLEFMAYTLEKDYDSCYEVLNQYKETNGIKILSNYTYLLSLLNYLTKNAPIYAYQDKYQDNQLIFLEIKVVQQLSLHELSEAQSYWSRLQDLVPELYGDDFTYNGCDNIFALSLKKAKDNLVDQVSPLDLDKLLNLNNNDEKLDYIFSYDSFYSKDDLIKYLWQEEWTPQLDNRLRTILSRYKKKRSIKLTKTSGKYKKAA